MSYWRSRAEKHERLLKQQIKQKGKTKAGYEQLRQYYRKQGPVVFCRELKLTIKGRLVELSDDQKEFLNDIALRGVRFAIVTGARGSGKTVALAIYYLWRVTCFDNWDVACMGGSAEQSEKIQGYISEWERTNKFIQQSILKNVKRLLVTKTYNEIKFLSCSGTSVRGPHVRELGQDEVSAGEEGGGEKFLRAAHWEVSTSPDIHIQLTSTAHLPFGFFLETWMNAEKRGYKKYRWAVAKHKSDIKDPYSIFKLKKGWSPNVPWISQEAIDHMRKNCSDDEWLVEALGGISIRSGLVISPEDLEVAVCSECDVCKPYSKDCKLCTPDKLKKITERRLGIDWGRNEPHAFTVLGRLKEHVYVLYSGEMVGVRDTTALNHAEKLFKDWSVEICLPDPAQYPFNNQLYERGLTVHKLFTQYGGQEKMVYVSNCTRHFERKILHIPKKFEKLLNSIKQLSYDQKGRIRKINDHSFDSLLYGLSMYREDVQKDIWGKKRFVELWKE